MTAISSSEEFSPFLFAFVMRSSANLPQQMWLFFSASCLGLSSSLYRYHQTYLECVTLEIYSLLRTLSDTKDSEKLQRTLTKG